LLNPYWALNRVKNYQQQDRVIGLISGKYQINDWSDIQVRGSIDKTLLKSDNKIYADNYFSLVGSDYIYTNTSNIGTNFDILYSFKKDINKDFNVSGNVGGSLQQGEYSSSTGTANGLNKSNFFFMNNAKAPFIADAFGKKPQVQSLYGTGTLAFRNYMFLDVTFRNDWSSSLPKTSQSYSYPSVGLSAILSEMLTLPAWVTYGKARVTYAKSGYGGQEYLDRNYYTVNPGGAIITPTIQSLGDYKPEITTSFEAGLEWQFFSNRFGFNVTYYDTKTKNQLLLIGTPSASLFNQKYINAGLIQNKGVELIATGTPVRSGKFSWDIGLNYSKNINKIIELTESVKSAILVDDRSAQIRAQEGGSFGDMYVQSWEKDEQGRRLVDENGLPILTSGRDMFLGNYNPDFMMGITNTFSYGDFSLNFLIDYRKGGYVISGTQALIDADGHSKSSLEGREGGLVLDAYNLDGTKNTTNVSAQTYWSYIGDRYPVGELYAYSATNIRLRELVFGYRFPKAKFAKSSFIKGAKLSAVGRNLFFLQKDAPIDPEITLGENGGGLEYGALPSTRTFGLNLKLTF
jgi:outer membrane receptor protein involved in Fe transport